MFGVKCTAKCSSSTGFYSILKSDLAFTKSTRSRSKTLLLKIHFTFMTGTAKSITKLAGMTQNNHSEGELKIPPFSSHESLQNSWNSELILDGCL